MFIFILDNDAASVKSAPANTAAIISPYKSTRPNSNIKSLSKLNHEQKIISGNLAQTPKIQPTLSKPLTRRNLKLEQENSKSKVRRNSFYIPSPANSTSLLKPSDTGKKFLESGRYSMSKINLTINSDLSNRYK